MEKEAGLAKPQCTTADLNMNKGIAIYAKRYPMVTLKMRVHGT